MHGVVDQRAERNALGDEAMNAAREVRKRILLPSEVHAIAREIVADADAERDAIAEAEARPDLWLAELEAENASLRLAALPTRKHSDAAWERKVTELGADAMIAHRWFEKRFGEVMNGRDFAVKCEMADRRLAELLAAAREVCDHLYTTQDIARCREMAREAVAAFEEAPRG